LIYLYIDVLIYHNIFHWHFSI